MLSSRKEYDFWQKFNKGFLCLAPLAGISDSVFRGICKDFGADVLYSEMISVMGLCHDSKKTLNLCRYTKKEKPYIIQLFGGKPEYFGKAVKIIEKEINPQGIDINMGCPAKKIRKSGSGSVLMQNPKLAKQLVANVMNNTKLPVSIKLRASAKTDHTTIKAIDIAKELSGLNLSAITVHGRSLEQGFGGNIDFDAIKEVVDFVKTNMPKTVVIGNGGVRDNKTYLEMIEKTGCDGIMIGQGAFGNPWIFESIKRGKDREIDFSERKKMAIRHSQLYSKQNSSFIPIRKHLAWYFKGYEGVSKLRSKLVKINSVKELKTTLRSN